MLRRCKRVVQFRASACSFSLTPPCRDLPYSKSSHSIHTSANFHVPTWRYFCAICPMNTIGVTVPCLKRSCFTNRWESHAAVLTETFLTSNVRVSAANPGYPASTGSSQSDLNNRVSIFLFRQKK